MPSCGQNISIIIEKNWEEKQLYIYNIPNNIISCVQSHSISSTYPQDNLHRIYIPVESLMLSKLGCFFVDVSLSKQVIPSVLVNVGLAPCLYMVVCIPGLVVLQFSSWQFLEQGIVFCLFVCLVLISAYWVLGFEIDAFQSFCFLLSLFLFGLFVLFLCVH